ncbi:MAG: hypothetical protein IKO06_04505, partial [Alphaproteobacteria bacterium]|nr:hypothetical protein [Alphaproteobacteria bacterium]
MKKFLLFLICGILISSEVSAIGPFPDMTPTIPGAPQICPKCTADQQALLQSTLDHAKSAIMRGDGKQLLNNVVAQGKSYAIKTAKNYAKKQIGKLFGKKDQKPIAYTRVIKKTKTDLEDTEKVAEAFKKYFLYIPSDKEDVRAAYKEKREQFIEDTTLELYITSKEMAKDLQVMLSQLDLIDRCLIQGDDESCKAEDMEDYNCQQSEEKEDEMCYRRNAVMVAQIYDTIMKNNEYLVAMRAQYEAVRTLGDGVKPKEPEDKGKKVSSLSTVFESTTGYASEEVEDSELIVDRLPDPEFEFADNNTSGVETPMANSEATLNAFPALYEAEKHLTAALKSHNMKQQLPHFKDVFDNFHRAEKMHANAVENLEESQECVLGYLNQRYEDSQKVWLGNCRVAQPDGYVCHYNPEKSMSDNSESIGIYDRRCEDTDDKCYKLDPSAYNTMGGMSGWLINTYLNAKDELTDDSTPKAENYVINAVSVDNNKDRPVEPGTDAYVAENYKRQIGENGEVLLDEYLEDMRVLSQLRHDIGVVANEKINNDVINPSENGVFGKPYKPFPLWNDQIHFYDQYIAGKYENMRNYISDAPLFKETLTLGLKINEDQDYQAQSDAAGVVMKTAAAIRQEVAELINKLLADLGDEKDERIEKIKQLLSAEDAELAAITQEFEANRA